eukprot:m.271826 g.271826  ORF g.271826 m.271826 type:complete len:349 (-) comp19746_c0_seq39:4637-5683(-)
MCSVWVSWTSLVSMMICCSDVATTQQPSNAQTSTTSNVNFSILNIEGENYIRLNCASRAIEHPFEPGGISAQFVHVPKAAGTTIEHYLLDLARRNKIQVVRSSEEFNPIQSTKFFFGHSRIKLFSSNITQPLRITSFRSALSAVESFYRYKSRASRSHYNGNNKVLQAAMRVHQAEGRALDSAHATLRSLGVPQNKSLDYMIRTNMSAVLSQVHFRQSNYLQTDLCRTQTCTIGCAMRNVLLCEIVVWSDDLQNQWTTQMRYHVQPTGNTTTGHANPSHWPHQMLSRSGLEALLNDDIFREELEFANFTHRLANTRTYCAEHKLATVLFKLLPREAHLINNAQCGGHL